MVGELGRQWPRRRSTPLAKQHVIGELVKQQVVGELGRKSSQARQTRPIKSTGIGIQNSCGIAAAVRMRETVDPLKWDTAPIQHPEEMLGAAQCGWLNALLEWAGVGVSGVLCAPAPSKRTWTCLQMLVGLAKLGRR